MIERAPRKTFYRGDGQLEFRPKTNTKTNREEEKLKEHTRTSIAADIIKKIVEKGPLTVSELYKELPYKKRKSISASLTELYNRGEESVFQRYRETKAKAYSYEIKDKVKDLNGDEIVDLYYEKRTLYKSKAKIVDTNTSKTTKRIKEKTPKQPEPKKASEKVEPKSFESEPFAQEAKTIDIKNSNSEMIISKLLEGKGIQIVGNFDITFRFLE